MRAVARTHWLGGRAATQALVSQDVIKYFVINLLHFDNPHRIGKMQEVYTKYYKYNSILNVLPLCHKNQQFCNIYTNLVFS